MRFAVDTTGDGGPVLGVDLTLRETASEIYDWSTSEEGAWDFAPDTTLPNPFTCAAPGAPSVAEELYQTSGSAGVKTEITITATASTTQAVVRYEWQYRANGDTDWLSLPNTIDAEAIAQDWTPGTWDFRVRAVTNLGVSSTWAETDAVEIYGLNAAPTDPTGFVVYKVNGQAYFQWDLSPDLDVQINGKVVIRHSPNVDETTWNNTVLIDEYPGRSVNGSGPLMQGRYFLKFVDSSGNYSDGFAYFNATEGLVTGFTTVKTVDEMGSPFLAGTHENTESTGTALQIDITSSPTPEIYEATYYFENFMDHGSVATRRYEVYIEAAAFDTSDTIDGRLENIDDWDDFDGSGDIHDVDATVYARTTDFDPDASPGVWGEWTPFFVADFTCRAIEFKVVLTTEQANVHNISVLALSVAAKEPT